MCEHAATAAAAFDAAAPEYVPGARYFAVLLALVGEGLVDVKKSDPVKELAAAYLGSLGAAAFFDRAPRAFGQLKAAMEKRLAVIAEPLERTYEEEKLGERLSSLGEGKQGAAVRLDDANLLPMPKLINGAPPTDKSYEKYMLRYIVMASLACDGAPRPPLPLPARPPPPSPRACADPFVRKLRKAIESIGDPSKTKVEGRDIRVYNADGSLLATITRAPIKSLARMLVRLPRSVHLPDTLRATDSLLAVLRTSSTAQTTTRTSRSRAPRATWTRCAPAWSSRTRRAWRRCSRPSPRTSGRCCAARTASGATPT